MSITETPAPAPVKPKPKRKPARRAARPATPKATVAFPGLTVTECADSCGKSGCAISGKSYCAHPRKGGLQGGDMGDHTAVKRLQSAQEQLAISTATKRFS